MWWYTGRRRLIFGSYLVSWDSETTGSEMTQAFGNMPLMACGIVLYFVSAQSPAITSERRKTGKNLSRRVNAFGPKL